MVVPVGVVVMVTMEHDSTGRGIRVRPLRMVMLQRAVMTSRRVVCKRSMLSRSSSALDTMSNTSWTKAGRLGGCFPG